VKPREPRRKVLIKARMRVAGGWDDAVILNMSSRGLLIQSRQPPVRGSYVEVRRGAHVIVARAVWTDSNRFGALTQDLIPLDAVIHEPDRSAAQVRCTEELPDRRREPRPVPVAVRHERNRLTARIGEFAAIALLGAAMASLVFVAIGEMFATPMHTVRESLG
jgi:hypothetical protein